MPERLPFWFEDLNNFNDMNRHKTGGDRLSGSLHTSRDCRRYYKNRMHRESSQTVTWMRQVNLKNHITLVLSSIQSSWSWRGPSHVYEQVEILQNSSVEQGGQGRLRFYDGISSFMLFGLEWGQGQQLYHSKPTTSSLISGSRLWLPPPWLFPFRHGPRAFTSNYLW